MIKRSDISELSLRELAEFAITALRRVDEEDETVRNQERVVEAALAVEEMARHLRHGRSGRSVILDLLESAYPEEVPSEVLRHASGIQEFARRIRELRVEFGYDIVSTGSGYALLALDPDPEVAEKWRLMNEIRGQPSSALSRIEELFRARIGEVVTTAEVEYVAKISEGPRRVRELRTEHGLRIESHKDNPALRPGEYVLVDLEPIPVVERAVDAAKRHRVLERDGFACVICGRRPSRDRRIWLEVDHIVPLSEGGSNDEENLRTLDNECHRVKKAPGSATLGGSQQPPL